MVSKPAVPLLKMVQWEYSVPLILPLECSKDTFATFAHRCTKSSKLNFEGL